MLIFWPLTKNDTGYQFSQMEFVNEIFIKRIQLKAASFNKQKALKCVPYEVIMVKYQNKVLLKDKCIDFQNYFLSKKYKYSYCIAFKTQTKTEPNNNYS